MNRMQEQVAEFHKAFKHPYFETPRALSDDQKELAVELIQEEFDELKEAIDNDDVVETYDAILDLLFVTLGMANRCGMDVVPGFDEVTSSNMSKLGPDGEPIYSRGEEFDGRPKGKVIPGPNTFKPDLRSVLIADLGWVPEEDEV